MTLYGQFENCLLDEPGLTEQKTAGKSPNACPLDMPVAELDSLTATVNERDFDTVEDGMGDDVNPPFEESWLFLTFGKACL